MRAFLPVLLSIALSGCAGASRDPGLRKTAERAPAQTACPPPGAADHNQATIAGPSRLVDSITANETRAFGPVQIIWVHPPEEMLERCP
ncbi:MAG: hypothetical protein NVS2B9_10120 [Myxococcales bacterium]